MRGARFAHPPNLAKTKKLPPRRSLVVACTEVFTRDPGQSAAGPAGRPRSQKADEKKRPIPCAGGGFFMLIMH